MPDGFAPSPRRRVLSMTSLIDIIFLLLLFFMLSTSFSRHGDIVLQGAGPGGTSETAPRFLRLTAQTMTLDARPADLEGLADLLQDTSAPVIVAPQPDVTAQRLVDVLAVLGRVPGLSVHVLGG